MDNEVKYEVNLYFKGALIGDIRSIAENLIWMRRRTKIGVDEIDFSVNDVLFNNWCQARQITIGQILKPYALECRIVRNGVEVVGGFLATMPSYSPRGTSAELAMKFDGYLNLLAGVHIYNTSTGLPFGPVSGHLGTMIDDYIFEANVRSANAGSGFGFKSGTIEELPIITNTFNTYKTIKSFITDRCDNTTGAGKFDVYFHADKTYDVYADANFGDIITDWVAQYPANINNPSAVEISAPEVSGFASSIIAIGNGEISSNANVNTAISDFETNSDAVAEYGYCETLMQNSSITDENTLKMQALTQLANYSAPTWRPEIVLSGRQIAPTPTGEKKIWLGDVITVQNDEDLTGMTNGQFRVDALEVSVTASNAERIVPTLDASDTAITGTFYGQGQLIEQEIRSLKVAHTRGLGMADFFTKNVSENLQALAYATITVKFAAGSSFPPYMDLSISPYESGGPYLFDENYDEATLTYSVKFSPNNDDTYKISVVSSAEITELTVQQ